MAKHIFSKQSLFSNCNTYNTCDVQPPPTNAGLAVSAKLIPVFTFTAEGPWQVVADGVGAAALGVLPALIDVCTQDLQHRAHES